MTRRFLHGVTQECPNRAPILTSFCLCSALPMGPETRAMSAAWPQKTVKGLSPPANPESADPHAESGQR